MKNKSASNNARNFSAQERKSFHSALRHLLQTEFPGLFGPAVTELFATQVEQLFQKCHPARDRLAWGQLVWLAVAIDDPPAHGKRVEDTRLVPVVLDLVTSSDLELMRDDHTWDELRLARIERLCRQAHEQGGLLSQVDLGALLSLSNSGVGRLMKTRPETAELLPTRGSLHDLGQTLSHKRIICFKRLVEKKTTSQVAEETFHSPQAVEQYVQDLRRVQYCHDKQMDVLEIVQATKLSRRLVQEYLDLIRDFGLPNLNSEADQMTSQKIPSTKKK